MKTNSIFYVLCFALFFSVNVNAQIGVKVAPGVTNIKGELGIGSSSSADFNPGAMLHLKTTGSEMARFESTASSKWISLYEGTTRKGILWSVGNDMVLRADDEGGNVRFQTEGNNDRMTILGNGNVGIGTASPTNPLNLETPAPTSNLRVVNIEVTSGNLTNETDVLQLKTNSGATHSNYQFIECEEGTVKKFVVQKTGATSIGTSTVVTGYMLNVDGKAVCEELLVEDSDSWPDYVFESEYQLKTLEEVEESINSNGHLPGIPSAEEVKENGGIHVGDMQKRTIEKVEELTLYAIDANKKIKALNKENTELKNSLKALIKRIEQLEKK